MPLHPPLKIYIVAALAIAWPSPSPADDGHARGGPARAGAYPDAKLPDAPITEWGLDLKKSAGQAVIAGDRLIAGNRQGAVAAFRLSDGVEIWIKEVPDWDVYMAPTVVDGLVYLASNRGVTACRAEDGKDAWSFTIDGGAGGTPLVVAGKLIVGGDDGFAYALDAKSGKELWKVDIVKDAPPDPKGFDGAKARIGQNRARPGSASSDGTRAYLPIFDQCRVIALDLATGKTVWSYQTKGWIGSGTTVADGKVFVGSQDRSIHAIDVATGKPAWSFKTRWRADGDLAYIDGSIFGAASDGFCYRIDAKTGKQIWEYETPRRPDNKHYFLSGAPIVDATAVYFGSDDGYLYALNRSDGRLRWRYRPRNDGEQVEAPITDGKRLYVPIRPQFDYDAQKDKPGIHGIMVIGPR